MKTINVIELIKLIKTNKNIYLFILTDYNKTLKVTKKSFLDSLRINKKYYSVLIDDNYIIVNN